MLDLSYLGIDSVFKGLNITDNFTRCCLFYKTFKIRRHQDFIDNIYTCMCEFHAYIVCYSLPMETVSSGTLMFEVC